jgi:tRNA pseudouridine38-40 synthase
MRHVESRVFCGVEPGTQYLRATIAYDGTDYLGFQLQAKGRTVQRVLEEALARVTQAPVRVVGSSRTDSGAHAQGQVIAFHTSWRHSVPDLQCALNAVLPQDVVVLDVDLAPVGWHPRFSAKRRCYRYTVLNRSLRSPLDRRYAHLVTQSLNLDALRAGSEYLVGEHDFAAFGRPTVGENTVRQLFSAEWRQDGQWFVFDVVGNAFLQGMVRNMVGVCLQVGVGSWPAERVGVVLESRNRALAAPPAPACGLCLMRVDY